MKSVAFVLVTTFLVGFLGVSSFIGLGNTHTTGVPTTVKFNTGENTSTIRATISSSTSSIVHHLNTSLVTGSQLRFQVFLNTTSIASGQGVLLGADLQNLEAQPNNVSSSSNWPAKNLNLAALANCGTENLPLGLTIIQGRYTSNNITLAESLYLWNPTVTNMGCPPFPARTFSYLFNPSTDFATPDPNPTSYSAPLPMKAIFSFDGYWTGNSFNTGVFHYFTPGVYTLFAGDEWGDSLFLYFIVT